MAQKANWEILIIGLLVGIDLLVGVQAVRQFVLHEGNTPADASLYLLLFFLQLALIAVFGQWKRTLAEHQRLKEVLEHELELTRQVMENVEVGISVVDTEGRHVYVNRAACELLGVNRDDIVGQTAEPLLVFPSKEEQEEAFARVPSITEVLPMTLRRGNGETLDVRVKVSPRWHGGRIVGRIASISSCQGIDAQAPGHDTGALVQ